MKEKKQIQIPKQKGLNKEQLFALWDKEITEMEQKEILLGRKRLTRDYSVELSKDKTLEMLNHREKFSMIRAKNTEKGITFRVMLKSDFVKSIFLKEYQIKEEVFNEYLAKIWNTTKITLFSKVIFNSVKEIIPAYI